MGITERIKGMTAEKRIVILGAGPTGLGAAWRLNELEYENWELLEAEAYPGGLAASFADERGFTWDIGGHVLFSHYAYFDRLMDELLPGQWLEHVREAWVWMQGRFIPYPMQNNLWRLPQRQQVRCVDGLLDAYRKPTSGKPADFAAWLQREFGQGLCETFMFPYNRKVWAYPSDMLGVEWMGERVAVVDVKRVICNILEKKDDIGWGPNATFRFPSRGGTGAIWRSMYGRLPAERCWLEKQAVRIDPAAKVVYFADGDQRPFDLLLSTVPLDRLLSMVDGMDPLRAEAKKLMWSSTHVVGVGLTGQTPEHLRTKCWMYFPEDNCPFYRVTVFSNYSPSNTPDFSQSWSLIAEVSESPWKPVAPEGVVSQVVEGMRDTGLIPSGAEIASSWHRRFEYGYPTPSIGRDGVLEKLLPALESLSIYSRGRFGCWKYEVGNMDHSVMQGVEWAGAVTSGEQEITCHDPDRVNAVASDSRRH